MGLLGCARGSVQRRVAEAHEAGKLAVRSIVGLWRGRDHGMGLFNASLHP
jgi:hypothetical protein